MMPDQESLCSRRALMISPLLEMHNSQRFRCLVEVVAMTVTGARQYFEDESIPLAWLAAST
jgi:hypothetical protein